MSKAKYRRRKFLLDKRFQLGVPLQLLGWVALYALGFLLLAGIPVLVSGEAAGGIATVAEELLASLTAFDVLALLLVSVVFVLHGVLFTHRIVGPVARFKNLLRDMRDGQIPEFVSLRNRDQLNDLASEFASTCTALRQRAARQRIINGRTQDAARQLMTFAGDPDVDPQRLMMLAHAVLASAEQLDRHIPFVGNDDETDPGQSEFPSDGGHSPIESGILDALEISAQGS